MSRTFTASDRQALIRLASALPQGNEDRRAILSSLKAEAKAAAKAPKKLKGKKLEHLISKAYSRLGDRIQVNMMDLGKIYSAAEKAYAAAEVEEAEAAMEKALEAALTKFRMN